jgi:hypothetical protein
MKILIILIFLAGAAVLGFHIADEISSPGLFNDPSNIAIGLLIMAGVAHLIWGKR